MKHRSLEILHRLREYDLEQEEGKLVQRQREEKAKEQDCYRSLDVLQGSYHHSVDNAQVHDYSRRDGCVREAGLRHNYDLRQYGMAQIARNEQVQETLKAKTRADMIAKVLEKRREQDRVEADLRDRREMDDVAQNQFIYSRNEPLF
ncbi:MAG: hypothetical protein PW734_09880 [Verrucomicrobium sp.]|nr:hypothetical protein [Verrucomicrobium sp.]